MPGELEGLEAARSAIEGAEFGGINPALFNPYTVGPAVAFLALTKAGIIPDPTAVIGGAISNFFGFGGPSLTEQSEKAGKIALANFDPQAQIYSSYGVNMGTQDTPETVLAKIYGNRGEIRRGNPDVPRVIDAQIRDAIQRWVASQSTQGIADVIANKLAELPPGSLASGATGVMQYVTTAMKALLNPPTPKPAGPQIPADADSFRYVYSQGAGLPDWMRSQRGIEDTFRQAFSRAELQGQVDSLVANINASGQGTEARAYWQNIYDTATRILAEKSPVQPPAPAPAPAPAPFDYVGQQGAGLPDWMKTQAGLESTFKGMSLGELAGNIDSITKDVLSVGPGTAERAYWSNVYDTAQKELAIKQGEELPSKQPLREGFPLSPIPSPGIPGIAGGLAGPGTATAPSPAPAPGVSTEPPGPPIRAISPTFFPWWQIPRIPKGVPSKLPPLPELSMGTSGIAGPGTATAPIVGIHFVPGEYAVGGAFPRGAPEGTTTPSGEGIPISHIRPISAPTMVRRSSKAIRR